MDFNNFRIKCSLLKTKTQTKLPSLMSTGIKNLNRKFLELTYFKLSHIFERINFINNFVNSSLFTQIDLEELNENDSKIISSGILLYDTLQQNLQNKVDIFEQSKNDNVEVLDSVNSLFISKTRYAKEILLDIPGFYFDNKYQFKLHIEGLKTIGSTDVENFVTIEKEILPYKYGGFYKEPINITGSTFTSTFEVLQTADITIYNIDNTTVKYDYVIENGKIVVNTDEISDTGLYIEYTPIFEESKVPVDLHISKINLYTNYDSELQKNIIFIGDKNV